MNLGSKICSVLCFSVDVEMSAEKTWPDPRLANMECSNEKNRAEFVLTELNKLGVKSQMQIPDIKHSGTGLG